MSLRTSAANFSTSDKYVLQSMSIIFKWTTNIHDSGHFEKFRFSFSVFEWKIVFLIKNKRFPGFLIYKWTRFLFTICHLIVVSNSTNIIQLKGLITWSSYLIEIAETEWGFIDKGWLLIVSSFFSLLSLRKTVYKSCKVINFYFSSFTLYFAIS